MEDLSFARRVAKARCIVQKHLDLITATEASLTAQSEASCELFLEKQALLVRVEQINLLRADVDVQLRAQVMASGDLAAQVNELRARIDAAAEAKRTLREELSTTRRAEQTLRHQAEEVASAVAFCNSIFKSSASVNGIVDTLISSATRKDNPPRPSAEATTPRLKAEILDLRRAAEVETARAATARASAAELEGGYQKLESALRVARRALDGLRTRLDDAMGGVSHAAEEKAALEREAEALSTRQVALLEAIEGGGEEIRALERLAEAEAEARSATWGRWEEDAAVEEAGAMRVRALEETAAAAQTIATESSGGVENGIEELVLILELTKREMAEMKIEHKEAMEQNEDAAMKIEMMGLKIELSQSHLSDVRERIGRVVELTAAATRATRAAEDAAALHENSIAQSKRSEGLGAGDEASEMLALEDLKLEIANLRAQRQDNEAEAKRIEADAEDAQAQLRAAMCAEEARAQANGLKRLEIISAKSFFATIHAEQKVLAHFLDEAARGVEGALSAWDGSFGAQEEAEGWDVLELPSELKSATRESILASPIVLERTDVRGDELAGLELMAAESPVGEDMEM